MGCVKVSKAKAKMLRDKAERCVRLARETRNRYVSQKLSELAREFEDYAAAEEAKNPCRHD